MLALAHHIERLVDEGVIGDYAEAARVIGVPRVRLTQVMNLVLLSPALQEKVLTGNIVSTEHSLRRVVAEADWDSQRKKLRSRGTRQKEEQR